MSNDKNSKIFCSIIRKDCILFNEIQAGDITTNEVFYAFDTNAGEHGNEVRDKWIKPILEREGLELYYFKESNESGTHYLCRNICRHIREAAFIIADVGLCENKSSDKTSINPNVALEIGIAFGFQKNVIFIADEPYIPISNLAGIDICFYPSDFGRDGKVEHLIHTLAMNALCFDKVKIYRNEDQWDEAIAKAEISIPGDRLLFSRNLTRLSRPRDIYEKEYYTIYPNDHDNVFNAMSRRDNRIQEFNKQIVNFNYYDIYDKEKIEKYIKERNLSYTLSLEEIEQHIEEFERIISFPNYYVGLYEESIPFNYVIKGDSVVLMGRMFIATKLGSIQGILFSSREIVEEFKKQFWESWRKIKPEDKEKNKIVQWLKSLIKRYY
jgi:hypothetical protein